MVDITVGTNGATLSATLTNTGNTAHDFGVTIHYYLTGNTATGSSTTAGVTNLGIGATANISWNQPKTTLSTLAAAGNLPAGAYTVLYTVYGNTAGTGTAISTYTQNNAFNVIASTNPSGMPMPTGNITGWNMNFSDDFNGSTLGSSWISYDGSAGAEPGYFSSSHLSVNNSCLVVSAYNEPGVWSATWVTGGANVNLPTTYGKFLVRLRMDNGRGVVPFLILWPQDESWPPEVDFLEDQGESPRTFNQVTCWYDNHGAPTQIQSTLTGIDLTQWHTYGVEWTAGKLVYTIDGTVWATNTSHVPKIPMHLCVQTEAWPPGSTDWEFGTDSTTPANVNMYVDWVVQYTKA